MGFPEGREPGDESECEADPFFIFMRYGVMRARPAFAHY